MHIIEGDIGVDGKILVLDPATDQIRSVHNVVDGPYEIEIGEVGPENLQALAIPVDSNFNMEAYRDAQSFLNDSPTIFDVGEQALYDALYDDADGNYIETTQNNGGAEEAIHYIMLDKDGSETFKPYYSIAILDELANEDDAMDIAFSSVNASCVLARDVITFTKLMAIAKGWYSILKTGCLLSRGAIDHVNFASAAVNDPFRVFMENRTDPFSKDSQKWFSFSDGTINTCASGAEGNGTFFMVCNIRKMDGSFNMGQGCRKLFDGAEVTSSSHSKNIAYPYATAPDCCFQGAACFGPPEFNVGDTTGHTISLYGSLYTAL